MLATLSSVLGAAVVLLAAIGVYGLAAHTVAARKREIGVRMALGASRRRVRVSELWSAIRLAAVGVTVGIPLALATGRFVRAEMFGISTSDPFTLSATSATDSCGGCGVVRPRQARFVSGSDDRAAVRLNPGKACGETAFMLLLRPSLRGASSAPRRRSRRPPPRRDCRHCCPTPRGAGILEAEPASRPGR